MEDNKLLYIMKNCVPILVQAVKSCIGMALVNLHVIVHWKNGPLKPSKYVNSNVLLLNHYIGMVIVKLHVIQELLRQLFKEGKYAHTHVLPVSICIKIKVVKLVVLPPLQAQP